MIITFDIETLPCNDDSLIAEWRAELTAEVELAKQSVKAPANYKDQEKIDAYIADKINELVAGIEPALNAKVAKTSFDGLYGRIACIAWNDGQDTFSSSDGMGEAEVISLFFDFVRNQREFGLTFCGHNIAGFDLPFLKHRAIIHGIKPPPDLLKAMHAKPWDSCIADTMLMWSSDSQKRTSMDKLCRALGIEGKGDFDGSKVAETWPVDPQKVIDYCKKDVERTIQIYNRLTFK